MLKRQEIYEKAKSAILTGKYAPGDKLPSLREAAGQWDCDKITAKKAYDRLKEEGFIENAVGKGSFVRFPENFPQSGGGFNFYSAYISESFFPAGKASRILTDTLETEGDLLFGPTPAGGDQDLKDSLAVRYRVPADRMVIISGAQQGLDLARKLFQVEVGESFLFEDPTYSGALSLFKPKHFVPMAAEGPSPDYFSRAFSPQVKVFYSMPAIHNPTGAEYSRTVMEHIALEAERKDFYIIEDDYLSEFLPEERTRFVDLIPERTVFIKSLSKISAPGIRLGFLVTPKQLHERMIYHKHSSDIGTSTLMQKLVHRFLERGLLDMHLKKCTDIIDKRRKRLKDLLSSFECVNFIGGIHGYNLWCSFAEEPEISSPPWAEGNNFSFNPDFRKFFRLSFMGIAESDFENGISYLESLFGLIDAGSPRPVL